MLDTDTLLTYVTIVLVFVFIPGPATLLAVARSTSSGPKAGVATAVGIAAGDIIHTLLAILGLSAIVATSALLFSLIKYLGAAYLIYLGIKTLTAGKLQTVDGVAGQVSAATAFRQAIYSELLNPKTGLFFLSFLPQFVHPENGAVFLQLIELGFIFVVLGLFSTILFALSAGALGNLLRRNPSVVKWQSKVVGVILCSLGIRLALQQQ